MVPASERESSFRNIPCYACLQLPRSQALETLALDRTSPLCPTVRLLSGYRGSNFLMVTQPRVLFEGPVIMPGRRQSSRQNEIPRVWPEGLVSHAETSRHAYFLHPHFLGLKVGDLSPKALCEESFGGPETGSELLHLLHIP